MSPRLGEGTRPPAEIDLVCGSCGHAFRVPMAALADADVAFKCPSCRKPFKMNQRFNHDALDDLEKRRSVDPVDRVLNDLGKIVGN